MLKAVNILDGQSQYDVFKFWQYALAAAFKKIGIPAQVISGAQEASLAHQPGTMSLGFNLVRNWGAFSSQKPHFAWLVDHPTFHAPLFEPTLTAPPFPVNHDLCLVGNVDRRWVEFTRSFYSFPAIHFMPHAGIAKLVLPDDRQQREFDVVFFGTVDHPATRRAQILEKTGTLKPMLENFCDSYNMESGQSLDEALLEWMMTSQMSPAAMRLAFNCLLPPLTGYFLHAGQRLRVLRAIKNYTVHVFGAGPWHMLDMPPNIIVHEPVTYPETLAVMARSRLVLNHSPLMHWGGHERICDALLCGCCVLSSFSHFIRNEFGAAGGVAFYAGDDIAGNTIDDIIKTALADKDAPARITAAQHVVMEKHLMLHRAQTIRDLARARW